MKSCEIECRRAWAEISLDRREDCGLKDYTFGDMMGAEYNPCEPYQRPFNQRNDTLFQYLALWRRDELREWLGVEREESSSDEESSEED